MEQVTLPVLADGSQQSDEDEEEEEEAEDGGEGEAQLRVVSMAAGRCWISASLWPDGGHVSLTPHPLPFHPRQRRWRWMGPRAARVPGPPAPRSAPRVRGRAGGVGGLGAGTAIWGAGWVCWGEASGKQRVRTLAPHITCHTNLPPKCSAPRLFWAGRVCAPARHAQPPGLGARGGCGEGRVAACADADGEARFEGAPGSLRTGRRRGRPQPPSA